MMASLAQEQDIVDAVGARQDSKAPGWACAKCTFHNDSGQVRCLICAARRPLPVQVCPAGHTCGSHITPRAGWSCQLCSRILAAHTALYSCADCDWDACGECVFKCEAPEPKVHLCPAGHICSHHTTPRPGWSCQLCSRLLVAHTALYSCADCDWDACGDCVLKEPKVPSGLQGQPSDDSISAGPAGLVVGGNVELLLAPGEWLCPQCTYRQKPFRGRSKPRCEVCLFPCPAARPDPYAFLRVQQAVQFPAPLDRKVNMMPFVIGDESSLPHYLRCYWPLIVACGVRPDELHNVGYLTIDEGVVEAGGSQRRGGLHTEAPGCNPSVYTGKGEVALTPRVPQLANYKNAGMADLVKQDKEVTRSQGVYMASTVDDSCRIHKIIIEDPNSNVAAGGNVDHLRSRCGEGTLMKAGELFWLTDRTPHEALPAPTATYRQYFRLVAGPVSTWFSKHNTANPLGTRAAGRIVDWDKFSGPTLDEVPRNHWQCHKCTLSNRDTLSRCGACGTHDPSKPQPVASSFGGGYCHFGGGQAAPTPVQPRYVRPPLAAKPPQPAYSRFGGGSVAVEPDYDPFGRGRVVPKPVYFLSGSAAAPAEHVRDHEFSAQSSHDFHRPFRAPAELEDDHVAMLRPR